MRRRHMSTGAWIFATAALVLAVGARISYAAVSSTVAIGNIGSSTTTATVTGQHQLLTTTVAPRDVVHVHGSAGSVCQAVYTPPAGKAIVVMSVTYDVYGNTAGSELYAYLYTANCGSEAYDYVDTDLGDETESRTFPIGLPMPSVGMRTFGATGRSK